MKLRLILSLTGFKHSRTLILILFQLFSVMATAQQWDLVKEKDNIKIYTRVEVGRSLKSFRGVADLDAPVEKVFNLMEDVNDKSWWDKNISLTNVLKYEKYKTARYYLVYRSPWPIPDRDLCVDIKIRIDNVSGERHIDATSINGIVAEKANVVRITDYRQSWTIIPAGKDRTHIILEGYVDPAGMIPDWIYNMLIVDTPLRVINGLKAALNK